MKILVLNGPNLNLLGTREPEHYGSRTLAEIIEQLEVEAVRSGVAISALQSNAEHELIESIHQAAKERFDFIIINPAAFTHTSIGLRDALQAVGIPFIEVHLSNVHAREAFREKSYFSDIAFGVISGLGPAGYGLALQAAIKHMNEKK